MSSCAVVLAAGKGTRMRSRTSKVLHPVLGRPMVCWPVQAAFDSGAERVVVVVGHQSEDVVATLRQAFPDRDLAFVEQTEQRGTGHAVMCALGATAGLDDVLILCGDTPALSARVLRELAATHGAAKATLTVTTFELDDATGYGRVVRDGQSRPLRIVEHKDASETERAISEVNAGLYLVEREALVYALGQIDSHNAQGELYLTDVLEVLVERGETAAAYLLDDPLVLAGVNTRAQLATLERYLGGALKRELMASGVTLRLPETIAIDVGVRIAADTRIGSGAVLEGHTVVGAGSEIGPGCVLRDAAIGAGARLGPHVVVEGGTVAAGAEVAPLTHISAEA